jgi:hypothetical protein
MIFIGCWAAADFDFLPGYQSARSIKKNTGVGEQGVNRELVI